jgi:hypothetical protein
MKKMDRRNFIKKAGLSIAGLTLVPEMISEFQKQTPRIILPIEFTELSSPEYKNISHDEIQWENISEDLEFSRTPVYKNKKLVDMIAGVKINPEINKINIYNTASKKGESSLYTIEDWQKNTNSLAIVNAAQYQFRPWGYPCALIMSNGNIKGPKYNKSVRGMLVSEPKPGLENKTKIKKADLLDFEYDSFNPENPMYTEGVQHWPILLDRNGKVKVKSTLWQANRTIVTKTNQDEIMFLTTEGGYFTLYNIGQFLRDSNKRKDKGFNVHTAMNLDGGYEACMAVKTPTLQYTTYGEFETQGPGKDLSVFNRKMPIAGTIGVSKR